MAFALAAAFLVAHTAHAQSAPTPRPKLALVIGNADYDQNGRIDVSDAAADQAVAMGYANDLSTPLNDAADMAAILRAANFDVSLYRNLNRAAFERAVKDFATHARGAGDNALIVFYFAGHGASVDGVDYLAPVGARLPHKVAASDRNNLTRNDAQEKARRTENHRKLSQTLYSVYEFIDAFVPDATGSTRLLIFDSCRNNPWFRDGLNAFGSNTRLLVELMVASQMKDKPNFPIEMNSTSEGVVALDGEGRNSPFAAALKKQIAKPGVTIRQMAEATSAGVARATRGVQKPAFQPIQPEWNDCIISCPAPAASAP